MTRADAYREVVTRALDGQRVAAVETDAAQLAEIGALGPVAVTPTAHVHELPDGAFVEVQVWVPRADAERGT